ncbi:hypothetical protein AC578_2937 [Pseudocercospora eumusae]|uniref:Aminotransferase class I/classII large domain-containing protein n=1 Tax=Pseudocercospora eumusae TaxID=321146 RepID=A0A139HEE5_9PEZI|nr:hypothetical protein AC578_2937 [Pseudocercospora eumusae]
MLTTKLRDFEDRRKTSPALPGGIAPATSSNSFRNAKDTGRKSLAWKQHLSEECRRRQGSELKAAASITTPCPVGSINLGTARPDARYFPWQSMTVDGVASVEQDASGHESTSILPMTCIKGEDAYDFGIAMNYGFTAGSPQLLRFITEHVELIHNFQYDDWETCLTCGTTSALDILFRVLCNPGDSVLVESYTYAGTLQALKPLGVTPISIDMDEHGLSPSDLNTKLQTWDETKSGRKPFILYTIPSGQNPTGITQPLSRKKEIYALAEKHNLLIIEDDPYYFLQLTNITSCPDPSTYLKSLMPSYLCLDTSGRVLRLDSTSKILAPGLRTGWLTGPSELINKFLNYTEYSTVAPSGPSQIMLYKLLDQTWGHIGFLRWLMHLSRQYRQCRDILLAACERYLPRPLCRWETPDVGMFIWIKIDLAQVKENFVGSIMELEEAVYSSARSQGVQVSRGSWFVADLAKKGEELAFRMTFAAVEKEVLDEAVKRFAAALLPLIAKYKASS